MTSYFGESRDTVYCALEKEVLHMCLSRILSSKCRKKKKNCSKKNP